MADLYAVAFVGHGSTSKENVAALLADFMSEDKEYNPPIFPTAISDGSLGLTRSFDWVSREFGEANVDRVDLPLIVNALIKQREAADAPAIPFLIYAPDDDLDETDANHHAALKAQAAGIRVLDITAGLDDYNFPAETKVEEDLGPQGEVLTSSINTGRRRGVPRDPEKDAEIAANMQLEDPPWDEDSALDEAEAEAAITVPEGVVQSSVIIPAPSTGVQVTLSQATVDLLLATFTSLAQDVAQALVPQPKPEMVPVYVSEDGVYRKVEGRGRPRKGETRTEITVEQAEEMGL